MRRTVVAYAGRKLLCGVDSGDAQGPQAATGPLNRRFGRAQVASYPRPVRQRAVACVDRWTHGVQPAVVAARLLPFRRHLGLGRPGRARTGMD